MLETLPLWLRHGEVVWLPAMCAFGVATAFAWRRRKRGLVAKEAAKSRENLGEPGELETGVVTLSGTLRVESADGNPPPDGTAVVSSHRDNDEEKWHLVLDVAGTPVEIPRANVVAGSQEETLKSGAIRRHLCAGDAVRAHGRAERAGADDGGYRAEPGWRLTPDVGTDDAEKNASAYVSLAFEGAPTRPLPRALGVGAGIIGTVAGLALLWLFGWAALNISEGVLLRTPDSGFAVTLVKAAAATPFHHDEALGKLAQAWTPRGPAPRVQRYAMMERELSGNCDDTQQWLFDHRQLEPMLKLVKDCPSPTARRLAARAAFFDGRIKQARELLRNNPAPRDKARELWLDAVVMLLDEDLPALASAVRRLAVVPKPDPDEGYVFDDAQRSALECVAFWAEQPTSKAKHSALEKRFQHNATCDLLLFDRIDDPKDAATRQLLMDNDDETPSARLVDLWDALALEVGAKQHDVLRLPPAQPADVALGRVELEDFDHWLAPSALAHQSKDPVPHEARGRLALEHALALSAMGAFDEADHWLDRAGTELKAADPERNAHLVERLPLWRAAITARRGKFRRAAKELAAVPPNPRDAEPRKELQAVIDYATTGTLAGLRPDGYNLALSRRGLEAAKKSGGALVSFLPPLSRPVALATVMLAAPRLRTGRDALVDWLDHDTMDEIYPQVVSCHVDALIADTTSRAVALRALGDAKRASMLEARAGRLRKVAGQRRIAVPLAIFQMM